MDTDVVDGKESRESSQNVEQCMSQHHGSFQLKEFKQSRNSSLLQLALPLTSRMPIQLGICPQPLANLRTASHKDR